MADNSSLVLAGADNRQGIQLGFFWTLLLARAAVCSSQQSGESPGVTSIINSAWRLTGRGGTGMKAIY